MTDNLASQINNSGSIGINLPAGINPPATGGDFTTASPELALGRQRYQARKNFEQAEQEKNNGNEPAEELAELGVKQGSRVLLTSLWGAVWLDWTLLSLLGLNLFLIKSIFLPNNKYLCDFGDDYLIGRWLPNKQLAKYTEIILLMIINVLVLAIIVLFIYLIYSFSQLNLWDWLRIGAAKILPGGQTGGEAAVDAVINP